MIENEDKIEQTNKDAMVTSAEASSEANTQDANSEVIETTVVNEDGSEAKKPENKTLKVLKEIGGWILTVFVALIVAVLINAYCFRKTQVSGNSMEPTLHDEQYVFISQVPALFGGYRYGDIIVFDSTGAERNFFIEFADSLKYNVISEALFNMKRDTDKYYIKRVIGLPGDTITFNELQIYRNGVLVADEYLRNSDGSYIFEVPDYSQWYGKTFTVGDGELFVLGDNRNHSKDSRYTLRTDEGGSPTGMVNVKSVLGKVVKQ